LKLAFTLQETIGGLKHMALSLRRKVLNDDINRYIKHLTSLGLEAKPALDLAGQTETCRICGYAIATVNCPKEKLYFEACSTLSIFIESLDSGFRQKLANIVFDDMNGSNLPEQVTDNCRQEEIIFQKLT
jgi:hypothetical protein